MMLLRLGLAIAATVLIAAGPGEPPITVGQTTITNAYPDKITFQVRVASREAVIESVELWVGLRGDSTTLALPAQFVPTRRPIVWADWETRAAGVPPGAVARVQWRVRDRAGNAYATDPIELVVEDARFTWQTLGNEDLALWWHQGGAAFGQEVFDVAADALAGMQRSQSSDLVDRLHVVLYADDEAFAGWHDYVQDWVGGEAYPGMGLTVQIVSPDSPEGWIEEVIPHEVAHLFFHQATYTALAAGPPAWLDEGFATYHEFGSEEEELQWVRALASDGDLIPLRLASGSFGVDDERVGVLYAESLSAVTYLYEVWGTEGVADLLEAYRSGADTDEALLVVTGYDFEAFQRAWWEWLGGAPGMYPPPPSAGAAPTAAATSTLRPTVTTEPVRKAPLPSFYCCPIFGLGLAAVALGVSRRSRPGGL